MSSVSADGYENQWDTLTRKKTSFFTLFTYLLICIISYYLNNTGAYIHFYSNQATWPIVQLWQRQTDRQTDRQSNRQTDIQQIALQLTTACYAFTHKTHRCLTISFLSLFYTVETKTFGKNVTRKTAVYRGYGVWLAIYYRRVFLDDTPP